MPTSNSQSRSCPSSLASASRSCQPRAPTLPLRVRLRRTSGSAGCFHGIDNCRKMSKSRAHQTFECQTRFVGWLEFSVAVIGQVLSWPVLALVAVLVFRKPIAALLERMKSYEGLGQKFTFGEQLAKVEEEVDSIALTQPEIQPSSEPSADGQGESESPIEEKRELGSLVLVAQTAPSAAIMQAWLNIEIAVRRLASIEEVRSKLRGPQPSDDFRVISLVRLLELFTRKGILPYGALSALNDLRQLRNRVAHGSHEPTVGEAITYVETAHELSEFLNRLVALEEQRQRISNTDMEQRP